MIKFQHQVENCNITVDHPGGYCCEFQVVKELLQAYSSEPCVHCKDRMEQIEELESYLYNAKEDSDHWEFEADRLETDVYRLKEEVQELTARIEGAYTAEKEQ